MGSHAAAFRGPNLTVLSYAEHFNPSPQFRFAPLITNSLLRHSLLGCGEMSSPKVSQWFLLFLWHQLLFLRQTLPQYIITESVAWYFPHWPLAIFLSLYIFTTRLEVKEEKLTFGCHISFVVKAGCKEGVDDPRDLGMPVLCSLEWSGYG